MLIVCCVSLYISSSGLLWNCGPLTRQNLVWGMGGLVGMSWGWFLGVIGVGY